MLIPAEGNIFNECFETVLDFNFDLCTISTRLKAHLLYKIVDLEITNAAYNTVLNFDTNACIEICFSGLRLLSFKMLHGTS